jgi:hypothetical protein
MSASHDHLADARSAHDVICCHPGNLRRRVDVPDVRDTGRMLIPDDRIDDFIKRWKNAFDETLTREEARERAVQLVELYREIGRCAPGDETDAPPAGDGQQLE